MGRDDEIARGRRAIRASWLMEMQPEDVARVARFVAGLPSPAQAPSPVLRLAAAGQDLVAVRRTAAQTREMVNRGELQLGSSAEERVLVEVGRGVTKLVSRLEAHFGTFPEESAPRRGAGVRHTFLVEVDSERHDDLAWAVDLAHQANDAPTPVEPVGRMMLRAIGDDLREIARSLDELGRVETDEGEFRALVLATRAGCGELAAAIDSVLPPRGTPSREEA